MAGRGPPSQVKIMSLLPRLYLQLVMLARDLCHVPLAVALASVKKSRHCMQDELAPVLNENICQSAAVECRLVKEEQAKQLEAQATGEQSLPSACRKIFEKREC